METDLCKYELSRWEIDILNEFNIDGCLNELLAFIKDEGKEDFLVCLADDLISYKKELISRCWVR